MPTAILLAGGRSSRSGRRHKACRRLPGGVAWLDRQIDALRAAGCGEVRLVLGARPRRVLACLHRRVSLRLNRRHALGPFVSLQTGLAPLRDDVLILPIDVPAPPPRLLNALIRALQPGIAVAAPRHKGSGGHPVLLAREFAETLMHLDPAAPEARLDLQLRALPPDRRAGIKGSREVLEDLNETQAWRDYRQRGGH